MGAFGEAVAGLVSGVADIGFGLYDRWYQSQNNQRDFDYQKSLQQEIFNREDTAVQRRMADLKAAGLNPNLAAGSAANAGSVVGRSSTPGLPSVGNPVGTALDTAMAVSQLRAQRKQNKILQNQMEMSNYVRETSQIENVLNQAQLLWQLGIKDNLQIGVTKDGSWNIRANTGKKHGIYNISNNAPIFDIMRWNYDNQKNAAAMLQKDMDYYTADKIAEYLGIGASIFSGAGSGWRNFNYSGNNKSGRSQKDYPDLPF